MKENRVKTKKGGTVRGKETNVLVKFLHENME